MVKVSTNSGRILRSTALPRQLLVSLTFSTDQLIMFDLKENGEINSNIPIYTVDTDEKIGVQQTASLENVKYYQDQKHQASFMIETNYSSSCMVATFLYQNNEYVMRPEHCLSDIGKDMKFKLAKLNRTHILHSQPLKTDNRRQTFSSEQLKRHKRASTDYKIEMFFIIDYSIYDYWYMQSQATTAGGKDKEAKNSIIQFYSFVVNGTPHKAQFIENNKYTSSSQTMADSTVVLNAVTSWIKVMYGIPPHDHAMMFTRYDFTNKGSSSNVGLAYVSGMCSDQSVSVVEDHFDFAVLTSAAHELGHGSKYNLDNTAIFCFNNITNTSHINATNNVANLYYIDNTTNNDVIAVFYSENITNNGPNTSAVSCVQIGYYLDD
uniref:Peptidase M12B domain-containing protein n=1 Tax=Magallana gigas TaxID=29159 RepID=A0A8W8KVB3_MAGGI